MNTPTTIALMLKNKFCQLYYSLIHITLIFLLLHPMPSTAETKYLSLQDGKTLSRKEFNALKPKLTKLFENAQEDDLEFDSQFSTISQRLQ